MHNVQLDHGKNKLLFDEMITILDIIHCSTCSLKRQSAGGHQSAKLATSPKTKASKFSVGPVMNDVGVVQ